MAKQQKYLDFDQYIQQGEPEQKDKAEAWRVAIGLQAVDGLKTSEYLQLTARKNIEGDITIDEARELLQQYYTTRTARDCPQAQDKLGTSSGQVQDKFHTDNPNITTLIRIVGDNKLSVKEMMERIRLTGRDNFLKVYLSPSINAGFIRPLYLDSPRHPRQKYLLTAKGMMLLQALTKKEG